MANEQIRIDPLDGPFFEESIYVTPSGLAAPQQAALRSATQQAVQALGLREGPVHVELRLNDQGAWIVEIAPRSIGGLCSRTLRFGAGISLEELILQYALGQTTNGIERESCAAGVMMIPIPHGGTLRRVDGRKAARALAMGRNGSLHSTQREKPPDRFRPKSRTSCLS